MTRARTPAASASPSLMLPLAAAGTLVAAPVRTPPPPQPLGDSSPFASRPVATPSVSGRRSLPPPSSAASSALATPQSQGSGRQDTATVARICELGAAGVSVVEIDRTLHREQHRTSTGTRWPAKNDGRVVVRLLLNNGITPVAGDAKVARYVSEYASKVAGRSK